MKTDDYKILYNIINIERRMIKDYCEVLVNTCNDKLYDVISSVLDEKISMLKSLNSYASVNKQNCTAPSFIKEEICAVIDSFNYL